MENKSEDQITSDLTVLILIGKSYYISLKFCDYRYLLCSVSVILTITVLSMNFGYFITEAYDVVRVMF